jgi:hypothetical protein
MGKDKHMTRHERRAVADQEAKGFYASNDGKTTQNH